MVWNLKFASFPKTSIPDTWSYLLHTCLIPGPTWSCLIALRPPNAEKSHTRSQSKCCKHGWASPPPFSARNLFFYFFIFKYNKSLKDPVRGAGSAQVQIQSYRNRRSGNLARKVRNSQAEPDPHKRGGSGILRIQDSF